MNEKIIIVGENSDGPGYYAMLANGRTIHSGVTPIKAIENLIDNHDVALHRAMTEPGKSFFIKNGEEKGPLF